MTELLDVCWIRLLPNVDVIVITGGKWAPGIIMISPRTIIQNERQFLVKCYKTLIVTTQAVWLVHLPHVLGALCNIGYPSEIHLKLKSCEISFSHNSCFSWPIAASLSCSVQNFKSTGQLNRMLWTNEISRDLSLRWVSDGYPMLHNTPRSLYLYAPEILYN